MFTNYVIQNQQASYSERAYRENGSLHFFEHSGSKETTHLAARLERTFAQLRGDSCHSEAEELSLVEAVSCGGVVIHKGKVLLLYKNQNGKYIGWVLPKGTVEANENFKQTALREVNEEAGANATITKYIGKTQYTFRGSSDMVSKTVHWYLMSTDSFFCRPQAEEYFADAGFYKRHEAYHLLKFHDEKQMMLKAFKEYDELKKAKDWVGKQRRETAP